MIYINGKFLSQKITGVQRFAIEITKELLKLELDFIILCPKNASLNIEIPTNKILRIGNNLGTFWEQVDLPIYLKSKGDFILLNLCNTAPIFIKEQVVTIHDLAFLRNPEWFSKSFSLWYKFLIPIIAKRSKNIITVSGFSKSEIIELLNIPSQKIHIVYNSVSKFNHTIDNTPHLKLSPFLLFVGSMDPRKNIRSLIDAFNIANIPGLKLVLVGRFNKNFGSNVIEHNDNIIRMTDVDDHLLAQLYDQALAFVYPSLYEGFGIPVIEAMSSGCPVISSDSTSLPEVCGDAALYFNPYSIDELVTLLRRISSDDNLRQDLITKGYLRVKEFSWISSAEAIKNILTLPDL